MTILRFVGNFIELGYDDYADAPSLQATRGKRRGENKKELLAYLNAGITLVFAPGFDYDVLDEKTIAGSSSIATDGTYVWPRTLAYYVERYDVALPEEFEKHVAANSWSIPENLTTRGLSLPDP